MTSSSRPTTASAPRLPPCPTVAAATPPLTAVSDGGSDGGTDDGSFDFSHGSEAPDRAGDNPADEGVDGAG